MAERKAAPSGEAMELRIGVNVGDVIVEDGDLFGDGVNIAARLEGVASPGGIRVTDRVREDTQGRIDVGFEDAGFRQLKNIDRPIRVHRVMLDAPGPAETAAAVFGVDLSLPDRPSIAVMPFASLSDRRSSRGGSSRRWPHRSTRQSTPRRPASDPATSPRTRSPCGRGRSGSTPGSGTTVRDYPEGIRWATLASAFPVFHHNIAVCYVGLGDLDQARVSIEKARELSPALLEARLNGVLVFRRAEDRHRHTTFLRVAAGLGPPEAADPFR